MSAIAFHKPVEGQSYVDPSEILGDVNIDDRKPLLDGPIGVLLYSISLPKLVSTSLFLVKGGAWKAYHEGFVGFHETGVWVFGALEHLGAEVRG